MRHVVPDVDILSCLLTGGVIYRVVSKGLAKRSQHFNTTSCNIVGHNMLDTFGHPVAICRNMLDDVGSNLKTVKFFVQNFGCCMMLYSCGYVHTTLLD